MPQLKLADTVPRFILHYHFFYGSDGTGDPALVRMRPKLFVILPAIALLASSCTSGKLAVDRVTYQAIRTEFAQPESIPGDAKIAVEYFFNEKGKIQPIVYNLTSDVMVIDQTKSFLILPGGKSLSYYDPNVYTNTTGTYESTTTGTSFNLGAVASVMGVGGAVGTLMNATSVGASSTTGIMRQNSVSIIDQPLINVGPRGTIAMSKAYNINGICADLSAGNKFVDIQSKNSPIKFSVCITYSIDGGENFQKIVTNFYLSTAIIEHVSKNKLSVAFDEIYKKKPDALAENLFIFHIPNNIKTTATTDVLGDFLIHSNVYDYYLRGSLVDYQ